ncbi:MAG: hypothetical protein ACRC68_03225, partial [Clostridium sp.]
SDATAPDAITVMGANFTFSEGEGLNGYTFKVGDINSKSPSAKVNKDDKTVTISANFLEKGAVTSSELGDIITKALKVADIKQEVIGSGPISKLPGLAGSSDDKGQEAVRPADLTGGKFEITFEDLAKGAEKGAELNGYTFAFTEDAEAITHNMTIDKDSKKIQIKVGSKAGTAVLTAKDINNKLSDWGINDVKLKTITMPAAGDITGSIRVGSDGKNLGAPKNVTIAENMTIKLPKGKSFNNVEIQIGSLDAVDSNGKALDPVVIEPKPVPLGGQVTKITINGDFRDQNVDSTTLEAEINKAIKACGVYGAGDLTDNQKVTVSGSAKPIKGLDSSEIGGGLEYAAPGNQSVFGFDFEFGNGESLNGYKINIGQITSGTKTSAAIDEKNKTITINGDFVTAGKVTADSLRNILNSALSEKGIDQTVKVTGNADGLGNVESDETLGGTPVNSMNVDGTLNFVDATGDLKSY